MAHAVETDSASLDVQGGAPMASSQAGSFRLLGIPVCDLDLDEGVDWIIAAARSGKSHEVHFCNAFTIACADEDSDLRQTLAGSTLNFPDGIGVYFASRVAGAPVHGRVPGPDLMEAVLAKGTGLRHFFLGSTEETLTAMVRACERSFPNADIVGIESPPFRVLSAGEQAAQLERLRDAKPDIIWVGLGTPKQDHETARLAAELPAVVVAVGAAFDFLAGSQPRAPKWVRQVGFEWLYRLCVEPRRLWRRYSYGTFRFVRVMGREFRANRLRRPVKRSC